MEGLAAANHRSDTKDQNNKILVVPNSHSGGSSNVSGGRRRAYTELNDLLESDVMGGTTHNRVINLDTQLQEKSELTTLK